MAAGGGKVCSWAAAVEMWMWGMISRVSSYMYVWHSAEEKFEIDLTRNNTDCQLEGIYDFSCQNHSAANIFLSRAHMGCNSVYAGR